MYICYQLITWYISVAVRKTCANSYNTSASWSSPKWLASWIRPLNFRCPGATPGRVIDLNFSENVPSLVLRKVRKFQHRSCSRFWIPRKTWVVDENTPHLPLIGLSLAWHLVYCTLSLKSWDAFWKKHHYITTRALLGYFYIKMCRTNGRGEGYTEERVSYKSAICYVSSRNFRN